MLIDEVAERIALGGAFHDARAWFEAGGYEIPSADFSLHLHQVVQAVLRHHVETGKPIELPAVGASLRERGTTDAELLLCTCVDECGPVDVARLGHYVRRVREQAHLRRIGFALPRAGELLSDPELEYSEKIEQVGVQVFATLERGAAGSAMATTSELGEQILAEHATRSEERRNGESSPRINTGIDDLDDAIDGLRPGRVVVVGARSSHGKSTLCADFALRAALGGHPVLFAGLEQTRLEVFLSLLQKRSGIRPIEAREGDVARDCLGTAVAELQALSIAIDARRYRLRELAALIRRAKVVQRVEIVVVDYVQLVSNPLPGQSRATEVAGVTAELKRLALELDICVLAAAQLNKSPDLREGGVPRLSDLRESEAISHDADQVIFLVRPDLQGGTDGGGPYLVLAKNRHGGTRRRIPVHFDARTCSYSAIYFAREAA